MLFALSCADESSTQVVVLMDTDYLVTGEVDRIQARVSKIVPMGSSSEEVETWNNLFDLSSDAPGMESGLPATFGILPGDSDLEREIVIELEALATGSDRVLVSRRVKTGFVPGENRLVRMPLLRACEGVTCEAEESCGCPEGMSCAVPECISDWISPEDLEPIDDPGVLPPDAGIPMPDAGVPDGGGINCSPPLMLCGVDCVNTQADPRYCGDCDTACGDGEVCDIGTCIDPGDCRSNGVGCVGFSYCDESSGECQPGCNDNAQCLGDNEICGLGINDCVCDEGFESCDGACVDTQTDPAYCRNCETSCQPGDVCQQGVCLDPGDCRVDAASCTGFTYCDEMTGECLRGCADNEQCTGQNQVCDTDIHDCACAPDFHDCAAVCVSDDDVNSCGTSCTPCVAPPDSVPTCELGACGFLCDDEFEVCDLMCCPTSCAPGQVLYDQACAAIHLRTVDDQGDAGEHGSIVLDTLDSPHIAYYARSGRDLRYSTQEEEGLWFLESPDGSNDVGQYASLAVDAAGVVYVAYYNASDQELAFAIREVDGQWRVSRVGDAQDVGRYVSLALDSEGRPHVSYYDSDNNELLYAVRGDTGSWDVTRVDSDGDVGHYTSLAFDPSGVPHISYYDVSNKDLKLATRRADGVWLTETVFSTGDVGKYSSLAFDANGRAHVAFYDEGNKNLMYSRDVSSIFWATQTVQSQDDVGEFSSIALSPAGLPRISYYDETAKDLMHAVLSSDQTWALDAVDSDDDVGRYTSIKVDSLGHSHISYYDETNRDLKYALVAAPE